MEWLIGLWALWSICRLLAWRFQEEQNTTHGAARWSTVWEVFKAGLFQEQGLRLGDWTGRLSVFFNGTHALTIGSSGSSKGTSAVLPNLLSLKHILLVDPGGENTAVACKHWRDEGYHFSCINPFSMFEEAPWSLPAHGFNPFELIDANGSSLAADAKVIAEMLITRSAHEGGNTAYFKNAAAKSLSAMIVHIMSCEPVDRQNLATLYEYLNGTPAEWGELLYAMQINTVCNGLVANAANELQRIEAQSPSEFSGIRSSMAEGLDFLADPIVRENFKKNDVDFARLKGLEPNQKGAVISIVLPLEYLESHAAITRLALACTILTIQRVPLAKHKLTFLIDECAALGRLERFPNWLATLRKYNVSLWTIWQNVGQIVSLYGKNWQTIVGNCGVLQILGVGDLETARFISSFIGQTTVKTVSYNQKKEQSQSFTARPLIAAEELLQLDSTKQIVLMANLWPMILEKTPYWCRPELQGRYHPNPYYPGTTPKLSYQDTSADARGKRYYSAVWWMAPHPTAARIMGAPLVLFCLAVLFGGS